MADIRPLAVVTGTSSGIGHELAKLAARDGHDLVIAADRPEIVEAAQALRGLGRQSNICRSISPPRTGWSSSMA